VSDRAGNSTEPIARDHDAAFLERLAERLDRVAANSVKSSRNSTP
jgi:hypothetical protein